MSSSATFVTPTFAHDYDRFVLQRESMEKCGIELPHVAVVHHEDVSLFRQVPFRDNLTVLSTADVLPWSIERRRRIWGAQRRNWRYWVTGRGLHGWATQQLVKLAAPAFTTSPAIICLDSDLFFVGKVSGADFLTTDGRVHLYETTDDLDVEMAEWYAHSLRFLGLAVTGVPLRKFTHAPAPLCRDVLLDLHKHIQDRHGRHWMDAMMAADRIMEYSTYGAYARHIDNLRRVCAVRPELVLYYWHKADVDSIGSDFPERVAESGKKIVLVQSNAGVPVASYRALVQQAWDGREPVPAVR